MTCGDIEQHCLADTSVARHQQHPTTDSRLISEPTDELDVRIPPDEFYGRTTASCTDRHAVGLMRMDHELI
jgi:hypothetical protein